MVLSTPDFAFKKSLGQERFEMDPELRAKRGRKTPGILPRMKTPPSKTPDRPEKPRKRVVSSLLCKNGLFLILERSSRVGSYQGYWSCVSGYVEKEEDPLETALREVTEETGISKDSLRLLSQDGPNLTETETLVFESYWFLFDSTDSQVEIDWEHNQFAWVKADELKEYRLVPWFDKLFGQLTRS